MSQASLGNNADRRAFDLRTIWGQLSGIFIMPRPLFGAFAALFVAAMVSSLPTRSFADERCQKLEALHAQYAGVVLTSSQKALKRKLVVWYYGHCGAHNASE
jgi:hypothetical protein